MSVFNNNLLLGAAGQAGGAAFDTTLIPNSVWLDGSADTLTKTFSSGSAQTKIVISMWVQRNSFTSGSSQDVLCAQGGTGGASRQNRIFFATNDTLGIQLETTAAATITYTSAKVYRDVGWYHLLLTIDQTESAATQVKLFVNGVEVALTISGTFGAALSSWGNSSALHSFGTNNGNALFYKGYYAQTTMLVGESIQAGDVALGDFLDSFEYGTNGSQFGPKANADVAALASSAGGNSFCLDFANSSDLGNDISSNNNDFSLTSMAAANQLTNTPSLVFPVLNALDSDPTLAASLGFGNRLGVGVSDWDSVFSTLPMGKTGKWYFEVRLHTDTASNGFIAGIHETTTTALNHANYIGNSTATFGLGYSLYTAGSTFTNNTETNNSLADIDAGDVVMMAVDLDNNKIWWGENGTFYLSGNPATGANPIYTLESDTEYVFGISPSTDEDYFVNFGADSTFGGAISAGNNADENGIGDFKHAPPSGYLCLCSANLTAPELQGADHFSAVVYEGSGSEQTIGSGESGSNFTGLAFIKNRDAADDNIWMDRVIGTGGYLSTTQNDSGTAATAHGSGGSDVLTSEAQAVRAFGMRSVTIGTMNEVNTSGESYILWQWLLGTSATSAGSITTGSPTLTTTGLVADTNHFSIVQYTGNGTNGATFAHGLGAPPQCIIIKRRSGAPLNSDWLIYNEAISLAFNATFPHYRIATTTHSIQAIGNDLVQISGSTAANKNSDTHMAYCFRDTPGVFKTGVYSGNSSADGAYVSTGFTPKFVWIWNTTLTSAAAARPIIDTARYKFNGTTSAGGTNGGVVFTDNRIAEEAMNTSLGVNPAIDILADGFKLRANDSTINTGTVYGYICMADIGGNGTLPPIYGR